MEALNAITPPLLLTGVLYLTVVWAATMIHNLRRMFKQYVFKTFLFEVDLAQSQGWPPDIMKKRVIELEPYILGADSGLAEFVLSKVKL